MFSRNFPLKIVRVNCTLSGRVVRFQFSENIDFTENLFHLLPSKSLMQLIARKIGWINQMYFFELFRGTFMAKIGKTEKTEKFEFFLVKKPKPNFQKPKPNWKLYFGP